MRARCSSFTIVDNSVPAETCAITPSNSEAIGLDMPAWKRGFCRRMAAVSVEPARGKPEMKWKVRLAIRPCGARSRYQSLSPGLLPEGRNRLHRFPLYRQMESCGPVRLVAGQMPLLSQLSGVLLRGRPPAGVSPYARLRRAHGSTRATSHPKIMS